MKLRPNQNSFATHFRVATHQLRNAILLYHILIILGVSPKHTIISMLFLSFTSRGRSEPLSTLQSIPSATSSSELHPLCLPARRPGPTPLHCCPYAAPSGWWQEGAGRPEHADERRPQWPAGGDTQRSNHPILMVAVYFAVYNYLLFLVGPA